MKTKLIIKKCALLIIVSLPILLFSQKYEKRDKIVKQFDLATNADILFESKMGDLVIKIGNNDKAILDISYEISGNDEGDLEKVEQAIRDIEVRNNDMSLSIKASIFDSYSSTVNIGIVSYIKGKLNNGNMVKLKGFQVSYVLTVPDNRELTIHQKYNDFSMPDYHGEVNLDLYSTDAITGNLPNAKDFKFKYCEVEMGDIGASTMDLYDSDIQFKKAGDIEIISKYSTVIANKAGKFEFISYDDKIEIGNVESIKGEAKYTEFTFGSDVSSAYLEFYDSDIKGKNCGEMFINAKYSSFDFERVEKLDFPDCYDNEVDFTYLGEFNCDSKYTTFNFDYFGSFLEIISYDDDVKIGSMESDFHTIDINSKYSEFDIDFESTPKFKFDIDFTYTEDSFNDFEVLYTNIDRGSSSFKATGYTKGINDKELDNIKTSVEDGIRKASIGKIKAKMYDGRLNLSK